MKLAWLSGADVNGKQETYATIENLPDGTFVFTGDEPQMRHRASGVERQYMGRHGGKEPTPEEFMQFLATESDEAKHGRIKPV